MRSASNKTMKSWGQLSQTKRNKKTMICEQWNNYYSCQKIFCLDCRSTSNQSNWIKKKLKICFLWSQKQLQPTLKNVIWFSLLDGKKRSNFKAESIGKLASWKLCNKLTRKVFQNWRKPLYSWFCIEVEDLVFQMCNLDV